MTFSFLCVQADLEAVDNNGLTSLMVAANAGQPICVSVLLEAKADVTVVGTGAASSHTALSLAQAWGHTSCVDLLERA